MTLNLQNKYPGRFDPVSADYPQGKFKNRSSPTAQDGSYMERDWLNDWNGFFGALLSGAGVTPNGVVDTAQSSQLYNALQAVILKSLPKRSFAASDFIRIPDVPGGLIVNFVRNVTAASNINGDATVSVVYPTSFPTRVCGSSFWLVDESGNPYPATSTIQGGSPGLSSLNVTVRGVGSTGRQVGVSGIIVGY